MTPPKGPAERAAEIKLPVTLIRANAYCWQLIDQPGRVIAECLDMQEAQQIVTALNEYASIEQENQTQLERIGILAESCVNLRDENQRLREAGGKMASLLQSWITDGLDKYEKGGISYNRILNSQAAMAQYQALATDKRG